LPARILAAGFFTEGKEAILNEKLIAILAAKRAPRLTARSFRQMVQNRLYMIVPVVTLGGFREVFVGIHQIRIK
jgi:predicted CoA-binding protein